MGTGADVRRFGSRALAAVATLLFAGALLLLWPRFRPPGASRAETAAASGYFQEIRPILSTHCYSCHGNKMAKAKLNLEAFVLHTRYASLVTIGQFDGPDDPALLAAKRMLTSISMNVSEDQTGLRKVTNAPSLFDTMLPMPVPKP